MADLVLVLLEEAEELGAHDVQCRVLPDNEVAEEVQHPVPHLPLRALQQVAHLSRLIDTCKQCSGSVTF
jgi:hypothetical protein